MPEEIQTLIHTHLVTNPTLIEKIASVHSNINDDIQFDNDKYTELKTILLDYNELTT